MSLKRILLAMLAMVTVLALTGFAFQPAQAATCNYIHVVRPGQTLSWIGRYYGVSWKYLAQINGLQNPSLIYPGQRICIAGVGTTPYYSYPTTYSYTATHLWTFEVTKVVEDETVQILTHNLPSNVMLDARMGRKASGEYEWQNVGLFDTDVGGSVYQRFDIPDEFKGESRIIMRLVQEKKNKDYVVDQPFPNATTATGGTKKGTGTSYYYGGIPTIWISSVVRNSEVTIRTHNFPPNLNFDVLMGPMGTRGVGGYYVGNLYSGSGGQMYATFPIPSQLYNHQRIAIRTQNKPTGYYSYNWFYNNTTP